MAHAYPQTLYYQCDGVAVSREIESNYCEIIWYCYEEEVEWIR